MLTQLHGKPFTISLEGKARTIGLISEAHISTDRTRLEVTVNLTDEEIAGIFGAASDTVEFGRVLEDQPWDVSA